MRCATAEVNKRYIDSFKDCEKTLALVKVGNGYQMQFTSKSYADTKADIEILKDETHDINVYAELLHNIKADFADLVLSGDKKVSESILVIEKESFDTLVLAFEHILVLHETLSVIPAEWTLDSLPEYKDAITSAVNLISRENFTQSSSAIYNILSQWRAGNDVFEIIYSYFMYKDEELGGQEYVTETLIKKLPLPKGFSKWYSYYYNAMYISSALYQNATSLYLRDVSEFMYYYDLLLEETENLLKNEGDQLTTDLYKLLDGGVLVDAVTSLYCGYYYHAGILAESENFLELWDNYLELYKLYRNGELTNEDGQFVIGTNADKFSAVMASFAKLSPAEVYGFLSSMNFLYSNSKQLDLVLPKYEKDDTAGYLNTFSLLLGAYYSQVLGVDNLPVYEKLMMAVEYYALHGHKAEALAKFKTAMADFLSAFGQLDESEKQTFKTALGDLYTKYNGFYEAAQLQDGIVISDDMKAIFNELAQTIRNIRQLQSYIQEISDSEDEEASLKEGTYIVLFALYEKANALYDEIVLAGKDNADILKALYNNTYAFDESLKSLEAAFHEAGMIYWTYITGIRLTLTGTDDKETTYATYDIYASTKLRSYLVAGADLLYAQYMGTGFSGMDKDYLISAMDAFHGLDRMGVNLCMIFEGTKLHFDAVAAYYNQVFAEDASTLAIAQKLTDAARKYLDYVFAAEADAPALKDEFVAMMEEIITLKGALADTASFDEYLAGFYQNYYDLYDSIVNPKTDETPET